MMQLLAIIYPFWHDGFFYTSIALAFMFFLITMLLVKSIKRKNVEMKLIQQQNIARVDSIRKEHNEKKKKIRTEMLKREEERTRQWMESEKETLHVLNGVSTLLDLSDKIGRVESEKILSKLDEIQEKVEKITVQD